MFIQKTTLRNASKIQNPKPFPSNPTFQIGSEPAKKPQMSEKLPTEEEYSIRELANIKRKSG